MIIILLSLLVYCMPQIEVSEGFLPATGHLSKFLYWYK